MSSRFCCNPAGEEEGGGGFPRWGLAGAGTIGGNALITEGGPGIQSISH